MVCKWIYTMLHWWSYWSISIGNQCITSDTGHHYILFPSSNGYRKGTHTVVYVVKCVLTNVRAF